MPIETPVKEAMHKEVTAVCGRVKALLAECIAGRPASIDRVTVKNSLAQLPEDDPVTRFLDKFFDVVIAHTSALGSGGLASAVQIATAKTSFTMSRRPGRKRPLAIGMSFVALQIPTCRSGPQMHWQRLHNIMLVPFSGGHKELDALVAKAVKLLELMPNKGDEGKFRCQMWKDGSAIVKKAM